MTTLVERIGLLTVRIAAEFNAIRAAIKAVSINRQTGVSYVLVLADVGLCVEMSNTSNNTITIPANSSVAFPIGTVILVRQMGVGNTTIVAGSGVTIRNPHATLKLLKQYASVSLHKRGADEWCIEGNMAES